MQCRAFNGRCVTQWIADCLTCYRENKPRTGQKAHFGQWLKSQGGAWPTEERLTLTTFAMTLRFDSENFLMNIVRFFSGLILMYQRFQI